MKRGREKRPQHDKEGFGARKRDKSFFVASAKKKTTSGAGEREKLKIQEAPPLL